VNTKSEEQSIIVIGGGPAGYACALALSQTHSVTLITGPERGGTDTRSTALLMRTVEALDQLGVWESHLKAHAHPLRKLTLIDATKRIIRARPVRFEAHEMGEDAFGYNINNNAMLSGLKAVASADQALTIISASVTDFTPRANGGTLTLSNGTTLRGQTIIAADGKQSLIREKAGLKVRTWTYPQVALTFDCTHTKPHDDTSTEFHTESGPLTFVPNGEKRSSIVFVVTPERADELLASAEVNKSVLTAIKTLSGWHLDPLDILTPINSWPLSSLKAETFAQSGIYLTGETAHAFPPIGAQGFNLTMRDALALSEIFKAQPIEGRERSKAYHKARCKDVALRTTAVDLLDRAVLSDLLPIQALRAGSLLALEKITPLRKLAMHFGMGR
jgi:2-octaprenyl-6-methoxyphenol hydroxylase